MTHLNEEQLVAAFYGESEEREAALHLESCEECRSRLQQLSAVLGAVEIPVPERGEDYGAQVWHNLKGHLPQNEKRVRWWMVPSPGRWAAGAAIAAVVILAFVLGRVTQPPAAPNVAKAPTESPREVPPQTTTEQPEQGTTREVSVKRPTRPSNPIQGRDRILMVAVGDHLERSQMVLVELMNANPGESLDISSQQKLAEDLVQENRLYRQAAQRDKDASVASLLEELERVLVDVAHEPSKLTGPELASIKKRIEAQGIVFKVRVVGSQLRRREQPHPTRSGKST